MGKIRKPLDRRQCRSVDSRSAQDATLEQVAGYDKDGRLRNQSTWGTDRAGW
jgi:hypothetical protein